MAAAKRKASPAKSKGKPKASAKPAPRPAKKAAPKRAPVKKPTPKKAAPAKVVKAPAKAQPKAAPKATLKATPKATPKPAPKPTPPPKAAPVSKAAAKKEAPPAVEAPANSGGQKTVTVSKPLAVPTLGAGGQKPLIQAPPPPPPKPGHINNQMFSAVTYGLFAAINKTFGTFGQSVVKNASLRILEFGYKHGWLPPKSKDPVKAMQEFFGRLEALGYAEKIQISRKGDLVVCDVTGLADWEAVHELRELHYPLLPLFMQDLIVAFIDQYFKLIVAMEPLQMTPEKHGVTIRFTIHEKVQPVSPSRLSQEAIDADLFD